jgi:hypothetical protein
MLRLCGLTSTKIPIVAFANVKDGTEPSWCHILFGTNEFAMML